MMGSFYGNVVTKYLAICWNSWSKDIYLWKLVSTLYSENFTSYAQSAGNGWLITSVIPVHTKASEITREKSFNYNAFLSAGGNKNIPYNKLTWFIGFAEGDGAILTDVKNNRLSFVLTQKEGEILKTIRDMFGFGKIRYFAPGTSNSLFFQGSEEKRGYISNLRVGDNKNGFYRWIVLDKSSVHILAHLFNGNLVSISRINQLGSWIKLLNTVDKSISLINIPVAISLQDALLSGFTDAEGCFNVGVLKNNRYKLDYVIRMRFMLDQKNQFLLEQVRGLFGKGKVTERTGAVEVFRYTLTGFNNMKNLREYFINFPLLTKKSQSLVQWSKVHDMVSAKKHLNLNGLEEVRRLAKLINLNTSQEKATGSSLERKTKI